MKGSIPRENLSSFMLQTKQLNCVFLLHQSFLQLIREATFSINISIYFHVSDLFVWQSLSINENLSNVLNISVI